MNKTDHPVASNSHPSPTANQAIRCFKWEAGLQNQQEHHIILLKYEAVHPKTISGKILIRDANNFLKVVTVYIISNILQQFQKY